MTINLNLDQSVRQQIAQFLSLILSDTYVLYVKTQNFHWNLIDSRFYALHNFLEKQYKELAEATDELAERIRMLGEQAPGSLKQFLEMTSLKESDGDLGGDDMLQQLLKDHESICSHLRERIDQSSELGDEGTADLLIQRLRGHEKAAWMLRSHF
ncbi:Uncharacterized protein PRO82_001831 [Candidatus Protochlamydia amoebophila]|uniref:Dps family protein n=1 Tax=Candidatus Protochlamydia amoebophila TaxID=362787 RepID=UPI001BCA133A|nr:Dps family protein [Candidatus Protochlamydia amoebophila]MBS4164502.1 Uncharacterized protein [Candidatus Protochlamydia amoebophila]